MPRIKPYAVRNANPEYNGAFVSALHKEGYVLMNAPGILLKGPLDTKKDGEHHETAGGAKAIFNTGFIGKDRKRKQKPLPRTNAREFGRLVGGALQDALGVDDVKVSYPVWLVSEPGCRQQILHRDFPVEDYGWQFSNGLCDSVSVLLPVGRTAKLVVIPGSHRTADLSGFRASETRTVEIPVGKMLVFHGLLVHAGAGYKDRNVRVHAYVFLAHRGRRHALLNREAPRLTTPFQLLESGQLRELG